MSNPKNKPIVSINDYREKKQKKEAAAKDGWQSLDERIDVLDSQIEDYKEAIAEAEEAMRAMEEELKAELARRQDESPE